jgi:hypothetical protein
MRAAIKFNRAHLWPSLRGLVPSAEDPRPLTACHVDEDSFSQAICALKFGTTFKETQKARFPLTLVELRSLPYRCRPVILDVGASDGITSLDVIRSLPFQKYYVTDLNLHVLYNTCGKRTYFYQEDGKCILIVTDRWVIYPDASWPIAPLVRLLFEGAPGARSDLPRITLINPALRELAHQDVLFEKYNIFEPWERESVDLLLAANLLNRIYFSDAAIGKALENMFRTLNDEGRLVIIDNRRIEKATIFQVNQGRMGIERQINGGTEIENLVLNTFSAIS